MWRFLKFPQLRGILEISQIFLSGNDTFQLFSGGAVKSLIYRGDNAFYNTQNLWFVQKCASFPLRVWIEISVEKNLETKQLFFNEKLTFNLIYLEDVLCLFKVGGQFVWFQNLENISSRKVIWNLECLQHIPNCPITSPHWQAVLSRFFHSRLLTSTGGGITALLEFHLWVHWSEEKIFQKNVEDVLVEFHTRRTFWWLFT